MYSSIYHFFGFILRRRGHFSQFQNLEDFELPTSMIAARNKGSFPDIVLRHDPRADLPGGELIELKTTKTYSIASFNSTLPTRRKRVDSLNQKTLAKLAEIGENVDLSELRDVFYLLVGRIPNAVPSPLTKVCLVSGGFFETKPVVDVMTEAANEVLVELGARSTELLSSVSQRLSSAELQQIFAKSRSVSGSSIKTRFRVMAEVRPTINLMRQSYFPTIGDDSISFITQLEDSNEDSEVEPTPWSDVPSELRDTLPYIKLSAALDDIDIALKDSLRIGTLAHPVCGSYFLAQADL